MVIIEFINRHIDDIILIIIAVIIGQSSILISKFFKFIYKKVQKSIIYIKRKLKGQYTLNEMEEFENLPIEKLTKKQKIALDKCHKQMEEAFKDFDGVHTRRKQTINKLNKM